MRPLDPGASDTPSQGRPADIEARMLSVGDQQLMVALKRGASTRPPLLLFNGIGANWRIDDTFP